MLSKHTQQVIAIRKARQTANKLVTVLTILAIILFIAVIGWVGRQDYQLEQVQEQSFIEGNK